jgi:hypothetical protein
MTLKQQQLIVERQTEAIASLMDIVSEVVCGIASGEKMDTDYAFTVVDSLNMHALALGVTPSISTTQIADWNSQR